MPVEYITNSLLHVPDGISGVATVPPNSSGGSGAWAEVIASAAVDYVLAGIDVVMPASGNAFYDAYCIIDVGVGGAGSEAVIASWPCLHIQQDQSHADFIAPILIDLIPGGSRVSVRIRRWNETAPVTAWDISLLLYAKPLIGNVVTTTQPLKVLPAAPNPGVGIPGPPLWANSAYQVIAASLAGGIVIAGYQLVTNGNGIQMEVDLATGGAGAEVPVTMLRAQQSSQTGSLMWVPLRNPLDVFPTSARLTARGRGSHPSSTTNGWLVLGYYEKPL